MDWLYQQFGQRLRAARRSRELSQEYVANYVGLSRTSITNIEHGRQRIPLHLAYLLAEAVRSKPSDLLPIASDETALLDNDLQGFEEPVREWVARIVVDEAGRKKASQANGKTRGSRTTGPSRASRRKSSGSR